MTSILQTSRSTRVASLAAVIGLGALAPSVTATAQGATPQGVAARPPAVEARPLTASTRRAVVDTIRSQLNRHYVDADTGARIARHLAERLSSGAYDALTDPYRFADVLTTDLRNVNGDRHLNVGYDPANTAMRVGPEGIRMMRPEPGGAGRRAPSPQMVASARRNHFSLGRVDVLPANVGYLDVRGFSGAPEAKDAVVAALEYLKFTDAMIIDLRRNGGGGAELVNFLISHFTGPDTLASLRVKNRSGGEDFTRYTLATVPGPRRTDVPLYVLTSPYTASAGEDFAFVLKNLGRATVIGEPTAGAGHNNAFLDAGHGFAFSISFTRVMEPKTGTEWERVGVQPTVRVDPEKALETAHSVALKDIAAKTSDPMQKEYAESVREAVEAQLNPRSVSETELASYVGEYEGGRRISIRNGQLMYTPRPGAPTDPFVPLGSGRFAFGANRIQFTGNGAATVLQIPRMGGPTMTFARTK